MLSILGISTGSMVICLAIVCSNPWLNTGDECIGQSMIPLYPAGDFNEYGKGELTYTGYFGGNDYMTILHTPGSWDDLWGVNDDGDYVRGNSQDVHVFKMGQNGYYTITLNTKTTNMCSATSSMLNAYRIRSTHPITAYQFNPWDSASASKDWEFHHGIMTV